MGPEELAIITNPQFINATWSAGENWYHGMVARVQEANRLALRRNSFEAANAQYAVVNQELLDGARRQNEKWKAFANDLVRQHDEYAVLAKRLLDEKRTDLRDEVNAGFALERKLNEEKANSAEKDAGIARLQNDLAGIRGSLTATQESLSYERQNSATIAAENSTVKSALQASEGARQSALDELKEAGKKVTTLEAQRRDADLVTQAVEAAGMTVMYVTAQAMEVWAAQGKPPMLDNLMTSHFKAGNQPMTMREYLWFATLIKEMKGRNVPDHLIRERCKVDGIEDFLARHPDISDVKVDAKEIYVGWFVIDGACRPFGAETKRRCMQMMAGFVGEMAAKHAAHEKRYPEVAELSPHWFSGVYITPDIELLMSNKDIDPDKIDVFFGRAIQAYMRDPNVKISAFTVPGQTFVVGEYLHENLFAAISDDGNAFSAMVSADEEGARVWLADHVANEVGPALGRPGLLIEEARSLMKSDACPVPVVDVLPLTVSAGLEMRLKMAALVADA